MKIFWHFSSTPTRLAWFFLVFSVFFYCWFYLIWSLFGLKGKLRADRCPVVLIRLLKNISKIFCLFQPRKKNFKPWFWIFISVAKISTFFQKSKNDDFGQKNFLYRGPRQNLKNGKDRDCSSDSNAWSQCWPPWSVWGDICKMVWGATPKKKSVFEKKYSKMKFCLSEINFSFRSKSI